MLYLNKNARTWMAALCAVAPLSTVSFAASVNIHTVSAASGRNYTLSEDALLNTRGGFTLGLSYDYSNDPLVALNSERSKETRTVVSDLHTFDLSVRYAFGSRWAVGVGLPLHMSAPLGQANETKIGDMRAFGKLRLNSTEDTKNSIGVQVDATLPTGNSAEIGLADGSNAAYLSNGSAGAGARLIAERDFGPIVLAANAGYFHAPKARISDELDYRNTFPMSLSGTIPFANKWAINTEVGGKLNVVKYQMPAEFYVGGRYYATRALTVYAGGGMGNLSGIGSNDFRISAGLRASLGGESDEIQLAQAAPKTQVVLEEKKIVISDEIRFVFGSARLRDSDKRILDEVANKLKTEGASFKTVEIDGHSDTTGPESYNQILSEARAQSVKKYLISKGVTNEVLAAKGFGESRPKYKTNPENRRVEFNLSR